MKHDVKMSSTRDSQKRLETVSVQWEEQLPFIEQVLLVIATAGIIFGLLIVLFSPGWGAMLLLGGAAAFFLAVFYPGRSREVTFTADGQTLTPYGYAHSFRTSIEGDHAHLTSIESRKMSGSELFEVFVTSEYGGLFALSTNLSEQVAFKVAVLLTRQLRDLRASQASRLAGAHGGSSARAHDWGEAHGVLS